MSREMSTNLFPELGNKDKIIGVIFVCMSHNLWLWLWEALTPKLGCSDKILINVVFLIGSEEAGLQDLDCLDLLNP